MKTFCLHCRKKTSGAPFCREACRAAWVESREAEQAKRYATMKRSGFQFRYIR